MILTQEQEMIRDSIHQFAQERLSPFAAEWDRNHTFPQDALKELAGLGALGMVVPEEWGGPGLDYLSLVLAIEEIAAGDGATSTIVSVQNSLACGITMKFGTPAQKDKYLKPLARGEMLGCFCLTEPHTGSDASAIRTSAKRDGDHWVINGVKQFITTGKYAQVAIVFAVTDSAAGKKGISCFLVPTATPGYIVARIEEKMGQHASDTAQILFENCRIPADHLLGREGEGYKIALSNLEAGRIGIAAQSVGMARAAFEAAVRYAKDRVTFGVPIIQHQAVNFRLADMATRIEAARQLVWHAASSQGRWQAVPQGGVHGEAVRFGDGREDVLGRDPDPWRLRVCFRLSGRTHLPGRAGGTDLRGRQRYPASRHRPRHCRVADAGTRRR